MVSGLVNLVVLPDMRWTAAQTRAPVVIASVYLSQQTSVVLSWMASQTREVDRLLRLSVSPGIGSETAQLAGASTSPPPRPLLRLHVSCPGLAQCTSWVDARRLPQGAVGTWRGVFPAPSHILHEPGIS